MWTSDPDHDVVILRALLAVAAVLVGGHRRRAVAGGRGEAPLIADDPGKAGQLVRLRRGLLGRHLRALSCVAPG